MKYCLAYNGSHQLISITAEYFAFDRKYARKAKKNLIAHAHNSVARRVKGLYDCSVLKVKG